jgi:hypothetical protein
MIPNATVTVLLVILIILLILSLVLFFATKYVKRRTKIRCAERYRGKGALLPVANIHPRPKMMKHPTMSFDDSFRKSFYQSAPSSPSSPVTTLVIPEIRITFPDEDMPPQNPATPGQRTSRVVVVQVGESGAAYVTAPPPYEGFDNVDISKIGGLREKH